VPVGGVEYLSVGGASYMEGAPDLGDALTVPVPHTIFDVVDVSGTGYSAGSLSGTAGANVERFVTSGGIFYNQRTGTPNVFQNVGAEPLGPAIFAQVVDGDGSTGTLAAFRDGVRLNSAAIGGTHGTGRVVTILGAKSSAAIVNMLSGVWCERLICLSALDDATVLAVTEQLAEYWQARGVAIPLPDFRLSVAGAQAAFYRADDDSNVVLADGDTTVQSLVDMIPTSLKSTSHAP